MTNSAALASAIEPVPTYTKAPCWMQRKWAGTNGQIDTVRQGRLVIYKAPCDVDGVPAPRVKEVKTS